MRALLRRDFWSTRRILVVLGVLVVLAPMAVVRGSRETLTDSDFGAFWIQGHYFLTGQPLFDLPARVRGPAYPPFAGMVFQLFALLPLQVSAGLLYFVNALLIPVAIFLMIAIFDRLAPGRERGAWRLVAAIILSAQFFLNNMNLIQVNEIILVLCLLGIRAYLDGRDTTAAVAFVAAAAIKLVPAVFVGWLVLRGRRRAVLAVFAAVVAAFALPLVFRGVGTGLRDLAEYHTKVLAQFEEGHVISRRANQTLGAMVYRLTLPPDPEDADAPYRQLIPAPERTAAAIYRTGFALLLLAFLANVVALRLRHAPLNVFELASVFLVGDLLSGITWKAHLVTLLFTFYCFLSLRMKALPGWLRAFVYALFALMVVIGMTGRDLVGRRIQQGIDSYSLIVWTMILAFVGCIILSQRRDEEKGIPV